MRKRRQSQVEIGDVGEARAFIRKHGNILVGLDQFKLRSDAAAILKVLPQLLQNTAYFQLLWPSGGDKSRGLQLSKGAAVTRNSIANTAWLAVTLQARGDKINEFLGIKKSVDTYLLHGRHAEALADLDAADRLFGRTIWSVECRLVIERESEGDSVFDEFVSENEEELNSLVRYLIFWMKYRSSSRVTATNFYRSIDTEFDDKRAISEISRIFLNVNSTNYQEDDLFFIGWADMFALPDRYILFKRFLANHLANGAGGEALSELARAIQPLVDRVDDPDMMRIALCCGLSSEIDPKYLSVANWDDYSLGKDLPGDEGYCSVPTLQNILLAIRRDAAPTWVEEQLRDAPEGSPVLQIWPDLQKVLRYEPDAVDAVGRLRKICLVYSSASWASELQAELHWIERDARISAPNTSQAYHSLLSGSENPKTAFILDSITPGAGSRYLDKLASAPGVSRTCDSLKAVLACAPDSISSELTASRILKLTAIIELRRGDPRAALKALSQLPPSESTSVDAIEVSLLEAACMVETSAWKEAAEVAVTLLLRSSFAAQPLPMLRILQGAEERAELSTDSSPDELGQLAIAVLADFATRLAGGSSDLRFDAFQDFLTKENVDRPSDLIPRVAEFDREMIEYFFGRVCVPEVLDQSLNLSTTEEVENERAKLIVALTSSDNRKSTAVSQEALIDELQTIRMRQAVRDTQRQLDQSKIYVNVAAIKDSLGDEIIEDWNRYRVLLLKSQNNEEFIALEKELQDRFKDKAIFIFPKDGESIAFMRKMMQKIADEFSLSKEFGLNSNLSTNVRHGSIMRELRGPFARKRLVTNKPSEDSEYSDSDLVTEIQWARHSQKDKANEILKDLSKDVDTVIDHLNDDLLRVQSDHYAEGLFNYSVSEVDAIALHKRLRSVTDFDDFIDIAFDWLWQRTEKNLTAVRQELKDTVQVRLDEVGRKAIEGVEGLAGGQAAAELSRLLTLAREEERHAVEKVVDWFTRAKDQAFADYEISVAFEAAKATVQSYYGDLKIETNLEGDWSRLMSGWTLPAITKLFSLLVENAAEHSGIETGFLVLSARIAWGDDEVTFVVANPLSEDTDWAAIREKADDINSNYKREKAADAVAIEGGSGYAKIWNLLEHDLRRQHMIEARAGEEKFEVEIVMNLEGAVT